MGRSTTSVSIATYAGIDYHKRFSFVTIGDVQGNVIEQRKVFNDKPTIAEYFKRFPGVVCAVESCRGYEWYIDFLKSLGLTVEMCNPLQAKLIVQSKNKNDRVDSRKLMELLAKGYLPTCYQATHQERELRERLRWRNQLVRSSTRLKVLITTSLDKENKGLEVGKLFSEKGRLYIQDVELEPSRQARVLQQLEMLEEAESRVKAEDRWVKQQVLGNERCSLLLSVPGIGQLTALAFFAEVGDVSRFRRASQVSRYLGLTPSLSSSADIHHLGPITKEGSKFMRWVMIEAAWRAIKSCPALNRRFTRIAFRRGRNKAAVAIARVLAEVAYHILKDGVPFDEDKLRGTAV